MITRGTAAPFDGQEAVGSLDEAINAAGDVPELIIAGGGQIYADWPADRRPDLHLTWVETTIADADTFFPRPSRWVEVSGASGR